MLLVLGGVGAVFALLATAVVRFAGDRLYRPRIEAAASSALGLHVRLLGHIGVGFLPGLHLTLHDVRATDASGAEVAKSTTVELWVRWLPLLRGELDVRRVSLSHPEFTFASGHPAPGLDRWSAMLRAHALTRLSVSDGHVTYRGPDGREGFELRGLSVRLRSAAPPAGAVESAADEAPYTAEFACEHAVLGPFAVSDLAFTLRGGPGVSTIAPIRLEAFGGHGSGSARLDATGPHPTLAIEGTLHQIRIEQLFRALAAPPTAVGPMDLNARLVLTDLAAGHVLPAARGELELRGEHLGLEGQDLDTEIARFRSSQNFRLVDLGAFFVVGPFGPAVTRGLSLATAMRSASGRSDVRLFVSRWQIGDGVAHARDVALATGHNRVAMTGGLDFVHQRFDDVTLAVLDPHGCAVVRQHVTGTFAKPTVEKPRALRSVTAPVVSLLGRLRRALPSGPCDVFYSGSVPAPAEQ